MVHLRENGTVKEDGSPHVVPIWFVLDNEGVINKGKDGRHYTYNREHIN